MGAESAETKDLINHPNHYTFAGVECIDVIEGLKLPFHLACVVKYIWRGGRKADNSLLQDLKKARWYLDRYISKVESGSL